LHARKLDQKEVVISNFKERKLYELATEFSKVQFANDHAIKLKLNCVFDESCFLKFFSGNVKLQEL